MAPSARTTNQLWGNAASMCSLCKIVLSVEPTPTDRHAVIGDVAHIVASSPDGPRGRGGPRDDIDGYDNLILLCKNDHKIVDDQPDAYTVERLRAQRRAHEDWVRALRRQVLAAPSLAGAHLGLRQLRYGPSDWMPRQGTNGPELLVRGVVALPGATVDSVGQGQRVACQVARDDREDEIVHVLTTSRLTSRLMEVAAAWGWSPETASGWRVRGGSPGSEITEAEFVIGWDSWRIRQPMTVNATVMTGFTPCAAGGLDPAVVVAVDMGFSVLELDEDRRPSSVAWRSQPPPSPGALSLQELADMVGLVAAETGPIAARLADPLVGIPAESSGTVYLWTQHDTVALDRIVNLTHLKRLPNAASSTRSQASGTWPFTATAPATGDSATAGADAPDGAVGKAHAGAASASALTQELLSRALEWNDYRRFSAVVREVSGGGVVHGRL